MILVNADHILLNLEDDTSWFNPDDLSETLDNICWILYETEGIGRILIGEDEPSPYLS